MTVRVRLFGLTIESELPLPGLLPTPECGPPDVNIRRGILEGGDANLVIAEAGSFAVRGGREIIVDAAPHIPERSIRLFLLGSAMGLLLHQRGLFPLHANAFALNGRAVAIAGAPGAGKSTLAAWLLRDGLDLLGDDVLALEVEPDRVLALPGPPRVRLWREALDWFGVDSGVLESSYASADYDKWDLPVAASSLAPEALPLAAVYVLEDGPELNFARPNGGPAAQSLFEHTYRGEYVERIGAAAAHWKAVVTLAATVPVFRLQRPRDLSRLEELGRAVLTHAHDQVARTSGGGQ